MAASWGRAAHSSGVLPLSKSQALLAGRAHNSETDLIKVGVPGRHPEAQRDSGAEYYHSHPRMS